MPIRRIEPSTIDTLRAVFDGDAVSQRSGAPPPVWSSAQPCFSSAGEISPEDSDPVGSRPGAVEWYGVDFGFATHPTVSGQRLRASLLDLSMEYAPASFHSPAGQTRQTLDRRRSRSRDASDP
jgi:hypothetical protein